jgi:hypothetical protein
MFLAKNVRKSEGGAQRAYYVLRDSYWDKKLKRQRHRYLAYIGVKPVLTLAKARELAKKIGCSVDDLRRVRRLKIVGE